MTAYVERTSERNSADLWITLGQRLGMQMDRLEMDLQVPMTKVRGFATALDIYDSLTNKALAAADDDAFFHQFLSEVKDVRQSESETDFFARPNEFDQGLLLAMEQVSAVGM